MKHSFTLGLLLIASLSLARANDSIEIQKTSPGEIRMKKSTSSSSSGDELKIEVLSPATTLEFPKIEINPKPDDHAIQSPSPLLALLQKLSSEPIQITIKNGKAKIHWAGGEEEVAIDNQGRFNLQLLSSP